jgi:hypothetical protein
MTLDLDGIERRIHGFHHLRLWEDGTYTTGGGHWIAMREEGWEYMAERLRAAEKVCEALSAQTDAANGDKGSPLMTDYWKATEQLEAAHEAWLMARGEG